MANGQSVANGPAAPYRKQGWDIRPVTHWDSVIGRDPA